MEVRFFHSLNYLIVVIFFNLLWIKQLYQQQKQYSIDHYQQNNILNISAQTTKDIWEENLPSQSLFDQSQVDHSKPRSWYANKGVAYLDNRIQAGAGDVGTSVDIRNDGLMDNVSLFNFQDPFLYAMYGFEMGRNGSGERSMIKAMK